MSILRSTPNHKPFEYMCPKYFMLELGTSTLGPHILKGRALWNLKTQPKNSTMHNPRGIPLHKIPFNIFCHRRNYREGILQGGRAFRFVRKSFLTKWRDCAYNGTYFMKGEKLEVPFEQDCFSRSIGNIPLM